MDATTRRRLEIEGYWDLGMWGEAQELLEEWSDEIPESPEVIAYMVMLGVAVDFSGPKQVPAFFVPTPVHAHADWAKAELAAL